MPISKNILWMPLPAIAALIALAAFQASMLTALVAQEPAAGLTLGAAISRAMEENPSLAAAKAAIQESRGERLSASRRPNPAFSLEVENIPVNQSPSSGGKEMTSRVEYEIETGGRRRLRTEAADHAVESQRRSYDDQARRLRLEVEKAFFGIILAESDLEATRGILGQVGETVALNRVRYEQGDISALELNRIEAEALRFQDDALQSELALGDARSALLALLGATDLSEEVKVSGALPVDRRKPEPGMPPDAPLDELIRMALERRADIAAALGEESRAEAETRLQRASRLPNVTAGGGYRRGGGENTILLDVTVPLKLFDRNEGEILRAEAARTRASRLAAATRSEVRLEVRKAHNAVSVSRRRVESLRSGLLGRAEEASRMTLDSYRLGGATLLDYLDAQRTWRDAQRTYNQALYDERVSLYELSNAIAWEER